MSSTSLPPRSSRRSSGRGSASGAKLISSQRPGGRVGCGRGRDGWRSIAVNSHSAIELARLPGCELPQCLEDLALRLVGRVPPRPGVLAAPATEIQPAGAVQDDQRPGRSSGRYSARRPRRGVAGGAVSSLPLHGSRVRNRGQALTRYTGGSERDQRAVRCEISGERRAERGAESPGSFRLEGKPVTSCRARRPRAGCPARNRAIRQRARPQVLEAMGPRAPAPRRGPDMLGSCTAGSARRSHVGRAGASRSTPRRRRSSSTRPPGHARVGRGCGRTRHYPTPHRGRVAPRRRCSRSRARAGPGEQPQPAFERDKTQREGTAQARAPSSRARGGSSSASACARRLRHDGRPRPERAGLASRRGGGAPA
jgi:hypothetical protein